MKKQQRSPGAVLKIGIGDGYHSYAQILDKGLAFFDIITKDEIKDMKTVVSRPVLFFTEVYNDVITKGKWIKVGKAPISKDLEKVPLQFIKDPITPNKFKLYDPNTGVISPATKEECRGLESASVWEAFAIEERLRDYYAGRPNKYLEQDKKAFI